MSTKRARGRGWELVGRFYNKTEIKRRIQEIKSRTPLHACVNQEDYQFLGALFAYHERFVEKTQGLPVIAFVHKPAGRTYSNFHFRLIDNREDAFSPTKCTGTAEQNNQHRSCAAYRNAIHDQIVAFKEEQGYGLVPCGICECSIANRDWTGETMKTSSPTHEPAHVDHNHDHKTFAVILSEFKTAHPDAQNPILSTGPNYYKTGDPTCWVLADAGLMEQWQTFHKENARLRFLCPECNLKTK